MRIFIYLLYSLVTLTSLSVNGGPLEVSFFRIHVVGIENQETQVLFGQVHEGGITVWNGEEPLLEFPYLDVEQAKVRQAEIKAEELEQQATKPVSANQSLVPVLQYHLKEGEVKTCLNTREFQNFLKQIHVFANALTGLKIHYHPGAEDCAQSIEDALRTIGLTVSHAHPSLVEGGILIQGDLLLGEKTSPPELALQKNSELTIKTADGTVANIFLRPGGFFLKSFPPSQVRKNLPLELSFKGPQGFITKQVIANLPTIHLGESKIDFANTQTAKVLAFKWDEVERLEVPLLITDELKNKAAQSLAVTEALASETVSANPFPNKTQSIAPINLKADLDINHFFSGHAQLSVPVDLGGDAVRLTYGDAQGAIHPFYSSDSSRWDLAFTVGTFLYVADAGAIKPENTTPLISHFIGAQFGVKGRYEFSKKLSTDGFVYLSPVASSDNGSFSLSRQYGLSGEYAINKKYSAVVNFDYNRFELTSLISGNLYLEFTRIGVGFRYHFF